MVLKRIASLVLRVAPWIVTAGALSFGSWMYESIVPLRTGGQAIAYWGIAQIMLRVLLQLGAVSAGSFALATGLRGLLFVRTIDDRRRFRGLAALGAAAFALGGASIFAPFIGVSIARSMFVVGVAGLLGALSLRSAWSLGRRIDGPTRRGELGAGDAVNEWMADAHGRVRTPVN